MDFYAFIGSLSLKLKTADNRYTYQIALQLMSFVLHLQSVEIYTYQLGRFLIIIKIIVIDVTMIRRKFSLAQKYITHVKLVTILNGRCKFLL